MFSFFIFAMIFQDVQHLDETGSWHSTFQHLNIKARSKAGSQKIGKSAENRNYNRYRDVVPYDHSLVRLRNSDTEYINANVVKVASINKEYILTQGPLANTCKHFWEMVWEQNTYSVVMLNRVVEKNQLKCYQYWPLKGSLIAGDIKVTVIEEDNHNEFIIRVLELEHLKEGSTRSIRHFHYVAWPDFGVPSSPQAFLKYLLTVQDYQASVPSVGPPVIHCSAGIGRSGTFALIDAALTEIQQKDDMMSYDVKAKLLEMRTYRPGLIQTTEQLHFSYIAILEGANMVAPSAYSTAYWSMADVDQHEEPEEDDLDRAEKRKGDNDQDEQPDAKEPRKEPIPVFEEYTSESESEEDAEEETVSLSDVNAHLNDSSDQVGENSSREQTGDNTAQVQETTENDNAQIEGFREITVTASSSQSIADKNQEEHEADIEADKGGTVDQPREKDKEGTVDQPREKEDSHSLDKEGTVDQPLQKEDSHSLDKEGTVDQPLQKEDSRSSIVEEVNYKVTGENEGKPKEETKPVARRSMCQYVQPELNGDATESESEDDYRNQVPSESSVCSGQFSSGFNIKGSSDVIGSEDAPREVASSSQSVEQVVNRWHCSDSEETATGDRKKPRSAMRRNSLEGAKRKSVTFVPQVNGEDEVQDRTSDTDKDNAGYVEEKETESSHVRRRATEDRKRNLANKVEEIKGKMKDSEHSGDSLNPTMIGLVLCVVAVGFAYFWYYRY